MSLVNIWGGVRSTPGRGNSQYNSPSEESTWNDRERRRSIWQKSPQKIILHVKMEDSLSEQIPLTFWCKICHPLHADASTLFLQLLISLNKPYEVPMMRWGRQSFACTHFPASLPVNPTISDPDWILFFSSLNLVWWVSTIPNLCSVTLFLSEWHGIPFNPQTWDQFPAKG